METFKNSFLATLILAACTTQVYGMKPQKDMEIHAAPPTIVKPGAMRLCSAMETPNEALECLVTKQSRKPSQEGPVTPILDDICPRKIMPRVVHYLNAAYDAYVTRTPIFDLSTINFIRSNNRDLVRTVVEPLTYQLSIDFLAHPAITEDGRFSPEIMEFFQLHHVFEYLGHLELRAAGERIMANIANQLINLPDETLRNFLVHATHHPMLDMETDAPTPMTRKKHGRELRHEKSEKKARGSKPDEEELEEELLVLPCELPAQATPTAGPAYCAGGITAAPPMPRSLTTSPPPTSISVTAITPAGHAEAAPIADTRTPAEITRDAWAKRTLGK